MANDILDSLLDSTLDDLADLPERKPFPSGAYVCSLTLSAKELNKKPAVEAAFKLQEVSELAEASDMPPETGAENNILFILKNNDGSANEIAQGQLKNVLKSLAEGLGISGTNREIMEAAKGVAVLVVFKRRKDKQGEERNQIVSLSVI